MRKSKETLHSQEVSIDAAQFFQLDGDTAMNFILGTINGAMQSVVGKMDKAGHKPAPGAVPQIVVRFEAKGVKAPKEDIPNG